MGNKFCKNCEEKLSKLRTELGECEKELGEREKEMGISMGKVDDLEHKLTECKNSTKRFGGRRRKTTRRKTWR